MITPAYCQLSARYGRWMNERLFATLAPVADAERKADRGAFFGSIHRTLSHLVWADSIWLARFTGAEYREPAYGADLFETFEALSQERERTDTRILDWSGGVSAAWLAGMLDYRAAGDGQRRRMPAAAAAMHLFNHATHHRAQVLTLMTQSGIAFGPTDLPLLPGVARVID